MNFAISIGQTGNTLLGKLWIGCTAAGLAAVDFEPLSHADFCKKLEKRGYHQIVAEPASVQMAVAQVEEYLSGCRKVFTLPIDWSGISEFQRRVLQLTCEIPYGKVSTYRELARRVQKPNSARAVGRAEATNPMPLVIPCHRVIGSDHRLHGYAGPGGMKTKAWLLEMENQS